MRRGPRFLFAGAAAVALAAVAGCSGGTTDGAGASPGQSDASPAGSPAASADFDPSHKGGTLTLVSSGAYGTLDPQVNYTNQYWQLFQATFDGLLAFKKTDGDASYDIVPDLAEAMPKVSDGGKAYTFKLRKGIKFSDGKIVTTDDVVASFERIFKVSSPTSGTWFSDIVGAPACLKTPKTCTLPKGVVANQANSTVTFHLTKPDPEFTYKLAVPHTTILPKSSPSHDSGIKPLPTTGPYMFKSYDPNSSLLLVRNPHFKVWSKDAQPEGYPDQIEYKFGFTSEAQVTAVQNGDADWMFDPPPPDRLNELGTKYASQVHLNKMSAMYYVTMNVNLPPFNNVKARQAINWGMDRNSMVSLFGGKNLAAPVCTILPPGFPGHVDDCQYTKGGGTTWKAPDLQKAKELVTESGTAGTAVTIYVSDDSVNRSLGTYLQSLLTKLGYKASVKPLSNNIQFTYIQNTKNKVQMAVTQWYADYPAASNFLHVLLSCDSFHPGSDSSVNIAGFCDKKLDAKMDAAEAELASSPDAANAAWSKIDQELMRQSPIAPVFTPKLVDFTSKRVGNYHYSRQFFMQIDQLWVQ
jgi:peptide/nickel transport system substrate-binding protein